MGCSSSKASAPTTKAGDVSATLFPSSSGVKSPKAGQPDPVAIDPSQGSVETAADVIAVPTVALDVPKGMHEEEHHDSDPTSHAQEGTVTIDSVAEGTQVSSSEQACQEHAVQSIQVPPSKDDGIRDALAETVEASSTAPTSRVLKNPQGWEEEGILFPHEGIRFLMQELIDATDAMDPLPAWKWQNLATWYQEYFYAVVHHHHDAEEQIYLPWIQTRASVPPKISADHPELMQTMDDLHDMFQTGATLATHERTEHLAKVCVRVAAFVKNMQDHLAKEEEAIPLLLREGGFTQEEEGAVVEKIIQSLGLDGNKTALPPMLHALASWAGEEKAEEFVSGNLPGPIRFLYRHFWMKDFKHRHMGLLASVSKDVDTNPFASWFCQAS
jgi:hemerythrin-like domain-containing protein